MTLVYDAFMTPAAASDLHTAALMLTGHPVHLLVNSHYHNDHIWGNQAFPPEVDILSTTLTHELIIQEGPKEIRDFQEGAQLRLDSSLVQLSQAVDEDTRRNLQLSIVYYQAALAALPALQLRLPNITYTGSMEFYGTKRSARLIHYQNAHCASDLILHLPEDGIVFMEDLLFVGFHPYLADGDPALVQQCLVEVRNLNPRLLVPGHGEVGSLADLDLLDGYLGLLDTLVHQAIQTGMAPDLLLSSRIPSKYLTWRFPQFFQANLKFLYQKHLSA